jgi:hypothetical protein
MFQENISEFKQALWQAREVIWNGVPVRSTQNITPQSPGDKPF